MQSTHLLHLSAAALQRNHCHATHLCSYSYIQPSDRQTVPDFKNISDSSEDLDQSAIRLQSGRFLINCLDYFLLRILCLIPRLRSGSWKLTAVLLLSDPEFLNKPFNLSLCVWLNLGSLSLVVIVDGWEHDGLPSC
ncbi:hypothetical protein ILYODFUR_025038 [Ilyodon furcidens]|uniref:Uncharacterized protein n=1 Tax=Ilyodon furcidens TaxID=33524 RepID=A0ABV0UJF5_9TELE